MEKINRPSLNDIPELQALNDNWEAWGQEFKSQLDAEGRSSDFSWKRNIDKSIVKKLVELTNNHCSFCDSYPLGKDSKQTIEHYFPKKEFPLKSYDWCNLFLCCDKCQSESNKQRKFIDNLKPDHTDYFFDKIFYFDPQTGKIEIYETLEFENIDLYNKAHNFLIRYGINNENDEKNKRCFTRKMKFQDIKNYFKCKDDDNRVRDDFEFRFIFDYVEQISAFNF